MGYPLRETRRIHLNGSEVVYTLVRRRRRTIGLKVDERGLTVASPPREPYHHLERILRERAAWIVEKLGEMARRALPPRRWVSGETLLVLGQPRLLTLYRTHTRTFPVLTASRLWVGVPDGGDGERVKRQVMDWYRSFARQHFAERIGCLAPRLELPPPPFKLSEARTTWGVCTASGVIRLSWRLIKAPQEQIDYVVAHELAHLRHMDHSRAFWQTVESVFPDYRLARAALERDGHRYHSF